MMLYKYVCTHDNKYSGNNEQDGEREDRENIYI